MSLDQTKIALTLAALTFLVIGGLLTFDPAFMFSLNAIVLDPSPAMMSEIRAPGALILFSGVLAVAGLINRRIESYALFAAAGLLLSYGFGRLVSLPLDGVPPLSLVFATAIELGLGTWCAVLLRRGKLPAPLPA
ncbi:MAG: DUF4345 domain-containing protein [Roseibium sp.]|uniref:DUF4345 domain-containing protein n=1 Tax=Roseibium sp. TaxID=1936156 RepID=UPI001B0AB8BE|nr:DUF4345 domain-containing protein [Roseibium sp.]MBO6891241.1 DUF4345 domain-containing protein [Roseibium sp.]MBO6931793.1 DUF4345 domain-containing protein [Roseibium sp.]